VHLYEQFWCLQQVINLLVCGLSADTIPYINTLVTEKMPSICSRLVFCERYNPSSTMCIIIVIWTGGPPGGKAPPRVNAITAMDARCLGTSCRCTPCRCVYAGVDAHVCISDQCTYRYAYVHVNHANPPRTPPFSTHGLTQFRSFEGLQTRKTMACVGVSLSHLFVRVYVCVCECVCVCV